MVRLIGEGQMEELHPTARLPHALRSRHFWLSSLTKPPSTPDRNLHLAFPGLPEKLSGFNTTSVIFHLPLTVFNFHDSRGLTPSLKRTWLVRAENCPKHHCLSRSLARSLPIPTHSHSSFTPSPPLPRTICPAATLLSTRCLIAPVPAGAFALSPCCRFCHISLFFVPPRRSLFPLLRPALCHAAVSPHRRAAFPCIKPCSRWST